MLISQYTFPKKDCIGAIDGTHSRVKVPRVDAPRFCGRKDHPTQNVLAACGFDMKFTYVLSGWEGTASDSRILKDALNREYPLRIPEGKFYLGDAGFMLKPGILTPYRGVRYHLKEYSLRESQNPKELFNHRHSSLRNVIERCFGVLKKRFPIIAGGTEPYYSFETMRDIFWHVVYCITF
ncbi:protein ALP1-like [Arachis stenosperma]|uniref:protein ALP1-like n=1 Tax=Arachis stenosperma TaxID=217475 RepID=UPI0025ACCB72|nr:protein ALP1-like [Arachis stenosperma]